MEEVQDSKNQNVEAKQPEQKPEQKVEHKQEKEKKPGIFSRIRGLFVQYNRVLEVASKPTPEEFKSSMKITASGILFVGVIGFIVFLVYYLVAPI